MDENTALERLRAGDEAALGWFIDRYTGYVTTIVKNMLLPRVPESDAEEAVADVFLALWKNAQRIGPGGVRAYLGGIARNKSRDKLRSLRADVPLEDDVLTIPSPGPDEALTERELHERTRRAVDSMSEPDREIFLRHYFYCQGVAEIALALDMNTNTVKTRLRRGREKLRRELTKGEA
ncbi:MAG TPA: sigma-70 family RNA polymerase sigma factor [Candidatus Scatomorpha merdigallinarum]|nr:sigma-70 family RNA polymerase sigma factor [Candidatus Scatomorpha merdigallinarum]